MNVSVSLTLCLIGTDEEPRWVTDVRPGAGSSPAWNHCCADGHHTPEAAAHHGAEKAAVWLGQQARRLPEGTCGALALTA